MSKERGLLLNKPLRAKVRSGEKTQTRRLNGLQKINKFPDKWIYSGINCHFNHLFVEKDWSESGRNIAECTHIIKPQYQVGDHLYLQEPYRVAPVQFVTERHRLIGRYLDNNTTFNLLVTEPEIKRWINRKKPYMKTSSRFMYKSLACTWFEVTGVRVERLQDISAADVLTEGVDQIHIDKYLQHGIHKDDAHGLVFMEVWNSTNNIKWADNPWVFAYTFKGIDK